MLALPEFPTRIETYSGNDNPIVRQVIVTVLIFMVLDSLQWFSASPYFWSFQAQSTLDLLPQSDVPVQSAMRDVC